MSLIRAATHADIPRLIALRAAVHENALTDPSRVTPGDYAWFIDNAVIRVWDEGAITGFSAADLRNGSIWALFVEPGHEGRGIGRALLARALLDLAAAGFQTATLTTGPGTRAEAFYRADGWQVCGMSDGELVFEKPLHSTQGQ